MRNILLIIIIFLNLTDADAQPMKKIQTKTYIKGTINFVEHNLSEVINRENKSIDESAINRFKVVRGKTYKGQDPEVEFRSSKEGAFLLELEPGTYSIVESNRSLKFKYDKVKDQKWDKQCLKKYWSKPLTTFKVKISEPIKVEFNYPMFDPKELPCLKKNDR